MARLCVRQVHFDCGTPAGDGCSGNIYRIQKYINIYQFQCVFFLNSLFIYRLHCDANKHRKKTRPASWAFSTPVRATVETAVVLVRRANNSKSDPAIRNTVHRRKPRRLPAIIREYHHRQTNIMSPNGSISVAVNQVRYIVLLCCFFTFFGMVN